MPRPHGSGCNVEAKETQRGIRDKAPQSFLNSNKEKKKRERERLVESSCCFGGQRTLHKSSRQLRFSSKYSYAEPSPFHPPSIQTRHDVRLAHAQT